MITKDLRNWMIGSLRKVKDQQMISSNIYETIKPIDTHLPRLCGLTKVYKPATTLRQIFDMYDPSYHTVAKCLVTVVRSLYRHLVKHNIKHVFQFVKKNQKHEH